MVNFGLGKNIIRSCLINSTQKSYLWVISPKYFCSWSLVIRKPVPKFADQLWGSAQIKNFGIKCSVVGSPVGSKWLSFVKCLKNIIKNNLIFTSTVWFRGRTKYLVGRTNEWVANPLGPGQTSVLRIKTRPALLFNIYL